MQARLGHLASALYISCDRIFLRAGLGAHRFGPGS
jgi:hypothetical protein